MNANLNLGAPIENAHKAFWKKDCSEILNGLFSYGHFINLAQIVTVFENLCHVLLALDFAPGIMEDLWNHGINRFSAYAQVLC